MIIIIHHLIGNRKDTLERQRRMMRVNRENRITLKNPTFIVTLPKIKKQDLLNSDTTLEGATRRKEISISVPRNVRKIIVTKKEECIVWDDNRANNVIPVGKPGEKKRWIHDPDSDLCQPLKCKKKEICLLEDEFTAVCVSKKELHKNGDIVVPKAKYLADQAAAKKKNEATSTVVNDLDDDEEDDDLEDEDDDVFYDTETDGEDETDTGDAIATRINNLHIGIPNIIIYNIEFISPSSFSSETEIRLRKKQKQQSSQSQLGLEAGDRSSNLGLSKYKYTNVDDGSSTKAKMDLMKGQPDSSNYLNKYMFVPKDFKYDNQHYKYIKYMKHEGNKYNPQQQDRIENKDRLRGYNDVLDVKPVTSCNPDALQAMGDRLLDWFSVIQADAKRRHTQRKPKTRSSARFPAGCRSETRWMFQHLDSNSDSLLSQTEIRLRKKQKQQSSQSQLGAYMPECDSEGYYHHTQCHASVGMCWCVDKHGVEFPNTRTRGKPNCEKLVATAAGAGTGGGKVNDNR
ncbi:proteoglycan Cow, partial [Diaphorina citri]|uniref:Proteoglycan Cow n=1 Tax=Diaphorina citri TaxID=121845 RepID=A0A3Q0IK64_DIACI